MSSPELPPGRARPHGDTDAKQASGTGGPAPRHTALGSSRGLWTQSEAPQRGLQQWGAWGPAREGPGGLDVAGWRGGSRPRTSARDPRGPAPQAPPAWVTAAVLGSWATPRPALLQAREGCPCFRSELREPLGRGPQVTGPAQPQTTDTQDGEASSSVSQPTCLCPEGAPGPLVPPNPACAPQPPLVPPDPACAPWPHLLCPRPLTCAPHYSPVPPSLACDPAPRCAPRPLPVR